MVHAADHFFDMIDVSGDGNLDPSELHPLFFPPTLPVPLPTRASPPSIQSPRALPVHCLCPNPGTPAFHSASRVPTACRGHEGSALLQSNTGNGGWRWLHLAWPHPTRTSRKMGSRDRSFLQHSVAQRNYDEFMKCADSNGVGR